MKIVFVIYCLDMVETTTDGWFMGWYDSTNREFVPKVDRATHYPTYEEAVTRIEKLGKGNYQIDKIFIKE